MISDDKKNEHILGTLLNQAIVKLTAESLAYTDLWTCDYQGVACIKTDSEMSLKVFHSLCCEYEHPFVIVLGAHIGTFSLVGAVRQNVRGWAFEPYADVFAILQQNIFLNSMNDRFTLFNNVLANFSGSCPLRVPVSKVQSHMACVGNPNYRRFLEQSAEAFTLDRLIPEFDIESVDIMRIDTEGSELNVLLGAAETIRKYCPDLLIKYNWFKCAQSEIYGENLLNYLEILGYQRTWVGPDDMLLRHPYRNKIKQRKQFTGYGSGALKIAIVKQNYDEFGPWQNEAYDIANPLKVINKWPSKYTYLEMTNLFKADWYVLPYCHDSRISRQKINRYKSEIDTSKYSLDSVSKIESEEYDVIISLDPILRPSGNSKTVFAYLQNEHHDNEYRSSIKSPLHGYDLFLDHMMTATDWVYRLPQSVSFPYPRDPVFTRTLKNNVQDDSVWIDNRFIMALAHGNKACHSPVDIKFLLQLEYDIRVRFRYGMSNFDDIQNLQSPYNYLQELSQSKYYLNLIACGAGQGLCDAASIGLICFGSAKLKYHQAICHPFCLCSDIIDFKHKYRFVSNSNDLQQEILAWQDLMLNDRMVQQPLQMLQTAVELKLKDHIKFRIQKQFAPSFEITPLTVGDEQPEIMALNYSKLKELANASYNNNMFEKTIDNCKQALFFNESDVYIYLLLACAYYALNDKCKSLEYLDKSKNIDKNYKAADNLIGMIGAGYIEDNYLPSRIHHNSCITKLENYLVQKVIWQIDDFDLNNIDLYDEIIPTILTSLQKVGDYETSRLIVHLIIQLKSVVNAEMKI